MNRKIGGFFEQEMNDYGSVYHDQAYAFNSGRSSLQFILNKLSIKKIYLPYYTCDVILQPLEKSEIDYEFYFINSNFTSSVENVRHDEAIIVNNYFGLLDNKIAHQFNVYGTKMIVDNSQAFYSLPLPEVNTFYSPRKFFGLPDGGFAYCNDADSYYKGLKKSVSYQYFDHLIKRIDIGPEGTYELFKKNDAALGREPMLKMSRLTSKLLRNIDFKAVKLKRNKNFNFLHNELKTSNELSALIEELEFECPMIYPYLIPEGSNLKKILIDNKIFVATYWPNINEWISDKSRYEYKMFENMIPLPIDQRLNNEDLQRILNIIWKYLHG